MITETIGVGVSPNHGFVAHAYSLAVLGLTSTWHDIEKHASITAQLLSVSR